MGKVPRYREPRLAPLGNFARGGEHQAVPECLRTLLDDPFGILADRKQWPVLNEVVASDAARSRLYLGWLASQAIAAGGVWEQAVRSEPAIGLTGRQVEVLQKGEILITADRRDTPETLSARAMAWAKRNAGSLWPYPVGKCCDIVQDDSPIQVLRDLMPFDGDVYAALVLPFAVGSTRMDVFFLVEPDRDRETIGTGGRLPVEDGWGTRGDVRRWVQGDPDNEDLPGVWSNCREWWGEVSGHQVKRGRGKPKGTGRDREFNSYWEALRYYQAHISDGRPTLDGLYEPLYGPAGDAHRQWLDTMWNVSRDKFERLLYEDWDVKWTEMVESVWGPKHSPQ